MIMSYTSDKNLEKRSLRVTYVVRKGAERQKICSSPLISQAHVFIKPRGKTADRFFDFGQKFLELSHTEFIKFGNILYKKRSDWFKTNAPSPFCLTFRAKE